MMMGSSAKAAAGTMKMAAAAAARMNLRMDFPPNWRRNRLFLVFPVSVVAVNDTSNN
jgi:hypothetical protein